MTSSDPDPDLQILREAETRRGGCGAFLVGAVVFGLFIGLIYIETLLPLPRWVDGFGILHVVRFVIAIAAAIGAAKLFTKVRLRLSGRAPVGPRQDSSEDLHP